jgi:hypothetical protein
MSAMVRRAVVVAAVLAVGALVAQAQPCNCPTVPAVQIDWLGSVSGCKPGGPSCATGETIQFTLKSLGRPFQVCDVFDWDFGDGSPHSTQQNPTHVYTTTLEDARVIFLITNCSVTFDGDARPLFVVPLTTLPSIASFTASSSRISPGQSVTLTWTTGNGSKGVRIESAQTSGATPIVKVDRGPSGSYTFVPSQSMDVRLTAFGDAAQRVSGPIRIEILKRHRAARH